MSTERLVIQIDENGSRTVKRNIADIGSTSKVSALGVELLKKSLGGLGLALAIRQVTALADSYTHLQNRLRVVTDGQEQLRNVTQELFDISTRTRSSFENTVELYSRVALASRELGYSQKQVLQFTESLNQAIIVSGASAVESSAGLIQLSQGLASGALRGDELRSVLEQLPVVADVIAKHLGVTRGQLRLMGTDGAITADIIFQAFASAREELAGRFARTLPTLGQAWLVLRNSMVKYVGEQDTALKGTRTLAQALLLLARNLDTVMRALLSFAAAVLAVKVGLLVQGLVGAISKFVALYRAVLAGNAVLLGSAVANKMKAAAAVAAAEAEVVHAAALVASAQAEIANTAAVIAGVQAHIAQAAVTTTGNEAIFVRAALLKQLSALEAQQAASTAALSAAQAGHATALNTVAAAQARYTAASLRAVPVLGLLRAGAARLWAVLLANPIAALVAGTVTLVAGLVLWGDKIRIASDHAATLNDVMRALLKNLEPVWDFLKRLGSWAGGGIAKAWRAVFGDVNVSLLGIMRLVARVMDYMIGSLTATAKVVGVLYKDLFGGVVDLLIQGINSAVGVAQTSLNQLMGPVNWVREQLGKDKLEPISLGQLDNPFAGSADKLKDGARGLGEDLREAVISGINQGAVLNFVDKLVADADDIAKGRAKLQDDTPGNKPPGGDPAKFKEYLTHLQREGELLQLNSQERRIRTELLKAEEKFEGKLTAAQLGQVEALLRNNAQLEVRAQLLDEIRDPQLALAAGQKALDGLLREGEITQDRYNRKLREFKDAADPVAAAHRKLMETLRDEAQLLRTPASQRDTVGQLQQLERQVQATGRLTGLQRLLVVANTMYVQSLKEQDDILQQIVGPQQALINGQRALDALITAGTISQDEYNRKLLAFKDAADPVAAAHRQLIQSMQDELRLLRTPVGNRDVEGQVIQLERQVQATGSLTSMQRALVYMRGSYVQSLREEDDVLQSIRGPQLQFLQDKAALDRLLRKKIISMKEYNKALREMKEGMEKSDVQKNLDQMWTGLWDNSLKALNDFAASGKFAFKDFANSIINDIQRIVQQQLLLMAFKAVGLPVPGYQFGGSFVVGGTGGPDSQLVTFRGTPGERVDITPPGRAPAGQPAPAPSGGGGVTIINLWDPDLIPTAMASQSGSQVILNTISNNPGIIKQVTA